MFVLLNPLSIPLIDKVVAGLATATLIKAGKYLHDKWRDRSVSKQLERDHHTPLAIKKEAVAKWKTYIQPDCQDNDPASDTEALNRISLFDAVNGLLDSPAARFSLLLADSGMGRHPFFRDTMLFTGALLSGEIVSSWS